MHRIVETEARRHQREEKREQSRAVVAEAGLKDIGIVLVVALAARLRIIQSGDLNVYLSVVGALLLVILLIALL